MKLGRHKYALMTKLAMCSSQKLKTNLHLPICFWWEQKMPNPVFVMSEILWKLVDVGSASWCQQLYDSTNNDHEIVNEPPAMCTSSLASPSQTWIHVFFKKTYIYIGASQWNGQFPSLVYANKSLHMMTICPQTESQVEIKSYQAQEGTSIPHAPT